jgi:hypothetical protein
MEINKLENISKHITWSEFCLSSQTAIRLKIDNQPKDKSVIEAAKLVANKCFEPIREHFGIPLTISSFYRSEALNKAINGAKNSQHITGQAIDLYAGHTYSDKNLEILNWAKDNLDYDQLINEYPDSKGRPCWVHISYNSKGPNRKQFITIS